MKRKIAVFACALLAASAFADVSEDECVSTAAKIQLLKQFDKDGDGRLNAEEREEARKALRERRADLNKIRLRHAKDVVAKFDKDGDGKLDETELSAFLEEQRKMFEAMRRRKMERMERSLPKEVLAKFDKNGDGKLDAEERRAMFKDAMQRRAALVKKYDKNGDGRLDEQEREEMLNDPEVRAMMKQIIGDGTRTPPPPPPPAD